VRRPEDARGKKNSLTNSIIRRLIFMQNPAFSQWTMKCNIFRVCVCIAEAAGAGDPDEARLHAAVHPRAVPERPS
jgi:hypothetical protein